MKGVEENAYHDLETIDVPLLSGIGRREAGI